ncbi:MAG: aspartate-semialdehyde dehydrogenase [Treponema sp.]|nr:aspartate-semialdehyde dehydrogenase [Treponema sp.]
MTKIPVGILGATGMVGQHYAALLRDHPWFDLSFVAASARSAGQRYADAVAGRWQPSTDLDARVGELVVEDAYDVGRAIKQRKKCAFVFSAVEMGLEETATLECAYAEAGIPVISNSSAHRFASDVPVLIPEINPRHATIIPAQQKARKWDKGFIVTKPNCSIQSYLIPICALAQAGFPVERIIVTTMQAVSGAGHPGVSSLDIIGNVIPYIDGEEEKSEKEPLKIFGSIVNGKIVDAKNPNISVTCNRVPVVDGHMACVNMEFGKKKPSIDIIKEIWASFKALPQAENFPSAPARPIVYVEDANRPQPRKDRDKGKGMIITVGRLRPCNLLDARFTALSHNIIRGAAGGGILSAEMLKHLGYIS